MYCKQTGLHFSNFHDLSGFQLGIIYILVHNVSLMTGKKTYENLWNIICTKKQVSINFFWNYILIIFTLKDFSVRLNRNWFFSLFKSQDHSLFYSSEAFLRFLPKYNLDSRVIQNNLNIFYNEKLVDFIYMFMIYRLDVTFDGKWTCQSRKNSRN